MGWVRVRSGRVDCLGRPRRASIRRSPEPQLAGAIVLKTGPGDVHVVPVLSTRVWPNGEPLSPPIKRPPSLSSELRGSAAHELCIVLRNCNRGLARVDHKFVKKSSNIYV